MSTLPCQSCWFERLFARHAVCTSLSAAMPLLRVLSLRYAIYADARLMPSTLFATFSIFTFRLTFRLPDIVVTDMLMS